MKLSRFIVFIMLFASMVFGQEVLPRAPIAVFANRTSGEVIPLVLESRIENWFTLTNRPTTIAGYGITDEIALRGWVANLLDDTLAGFATTNDIWTITNEPLFKAYSNDLLSHLIQPLTNAHGITGDMVSHWNEAYASQSNWISAESDPVWVAASNQTALDILGAWFTASNALPYSGGTLTGPLYSKYIGLSNGTIGAISSLVFNSSSISIGSNANANTSGIAIGSDANGSSSGTAIGLSATGKISGIAIGAYALAGSYGVAVGNSSVGGGGVAIGYLANADTVGIALGRESFAQAYSIALGLNSRGTLFGTSIGNYAFSTSTNIAIGYRANAPSGSQRISVGQNVTNEVDNSIRARGDLYLDGGTAVYYRASFGTGAWSALTPDGGYATGTPVYAESDPVWAANSTGYLSKVSAASTYVSIPAWQAATTNYFRLVTFPMSNTAAGAAGDVGINHTNVAVFYAQSNKWLRGGSEGWTLEW